MTKKSGASRGASTAASTASSSTTASSAALATAPPSAAASTSAASAVDTTPFDEKKLKPIHEAIDAGNHKNALKLLNAAIQKNGKKAILLALVALCHASLQAHDEARAILAGLPQLASLDTLTFQTLPYVYRVLDDQASLIAHHEHALTKTPKDEELMLQLFYLLTRRHDYTKLQTHAMKLYTSAGNKDKYLFWSSINLLMTMRKEEKASALASAGGATAASSTSSSSSAPASTAPVASPSKMLQLHEMMLHRKFGAPAFTQVLQVEEVLILIQIYLKQSKWKEIIHLLETESGKKWREKDVTEYLRTKAQMLSDYAHASSTTDLSLLNRSNEAYAELIAANNDDWFYLTRYIDGVLELAEKQPLQQSGAASPSASSSSTTSPTESAPATDGAPAPVVEAALPVLSFDERLAPLRTFITDLQQKNMYIPKSAAADAKSVPQKRGPFLAEVALEFRLWQRANKQDASSSSSASPSDSSSSSAALEKSILSYFIAFGSRTCFYYDVLEYVRELPLVAKTRLVKEMTNSLPAVSADKSDESAQIKHYQMKASVQQFVRYNSTADSSLSSSVKDLETLGKDMLEQFLTTTRFSSTILRVQTERGCGDNFLTLFAHYYISAYNLTRDRKYILDCIMLLEFGLKTYSQWNYQWKLWLIRLYCHPSIGAFHTAMEMYTKMDIKQIQHDITSHLIFEDALRYGHAHDAMLTAGNITMWHRGADKDDGNMTQFAYQHSNYSKVMEFAEFRERRQESLALYQARVVKAYGGLLALGNAAMNPGGVSTPVTGATNADGSPVAKIEKDLTNVHTFVSKVRADLLAAYPSISEHSSNSTLNQHLQPNNDYSIVTVWDSPSPTSKASNPPLNTMLNRPAPSLYSSSFDVPHDELLSVKNQQWTIYAPSQAYLQSLRFYRITLDLLWYVLEQQSTDLRASLGLFKNVLEDMKLAKIPENAATTAGASQPAGASSSAPAASASTFTPASFDSSHWNFAYLTFETSASIHECLLQYARYLDLIGTTPAAPQEERDRTDEQGLRWMNIQRQLSVLTLQVESLTKDIAARFYTPTALASASTNEEAKQVVHGGVDDAAVDNRPVHAPALRDLACFSQFGMCWLAISVQSWATNMPSKKTLKKLLKKRGDGHAPELTPDQEQVASEALLAARVNLATLIKAIRQSILTLLGITKKLGARIPSTTTSKPGSSSSSTATSSSTSSASLIDHHPTLSLLETPDNIPIVQSVLQNIDVSHAHAAANIYQLLHSIDVPLQQLKM